MISKATIKEFKRALKEEYGKEVSYEEASSILADLVAYYDTLGKINHREVTQPDI
jgi:hypothetical protein